MPCGQRSLDSADLFAVLLHLSGGCVDRLTKTDELNGDAHDGNGNRNDGDNETEHGKTFRTRKVGDLIRDSTNLARVACCQQNCCKMSTVARSDRADSSGHDPLPLSPSPEKKVEADSTAVEPASDPSLPNVA